VADRPNTLDSSLQPGVYEWRFDRNFVLSITHDADLALVRVAGDLDALTARNLEQRAELPRVAAATVVIDLSEVELIDVSGIRQIRRIEAWYGGAELRGACAAVTELLEMFPARRVQPR
jgi:hypothetical protein